METDNQAVLGLDGLQALLDTLAARGYRVVGPTVSDQAIVYDDIGSVSDLPKGWTDEQEAGHYRMIAGDDDALFGYAVGPHSWKKFLHPPVLPLWQARRDGDQVHIAADATPAERFAFIGVRSCELHAIAIQDRVFLEQAHTDPHYAARRKDAFIVAVNCSKAGGTCFCTSMGTGPEAAGGFDLALTEIAGDGDPRMVVSVGSDAGGDVLDGLPHRPAKPEETQAAADVIAATAASMGREMPAESVRDLLMRNLEHRRWDDVAERCLSCSNCTMVCPTCFCTSVEDSNNLTGRESARTRRWDSCFTLDFTYVHGGSVRSSTRSRYRQWMTHKLATWHDQFGSTGCVGCGRCITWCPVGIDITEEVRAIRDSEQDAGE